MASLSGDERQLGVWIARAKTSMQEATELKNALKSHKEEALALRHKAEAAEEAIQVLLNQEKQVSCLKFVWLCLMVFFREKRKHLSLLTGMGSFITCLRSRNRC